MHLPGFCAYRFIKLEGSDSVNAKHSPPRSPSLDGSEVREVSGDPSPTPVLDTSTSLAAEQPARLTRLDIAAFPRPEGYPYVTGRWPRVAEPKIALKLATLSMARELGVDDGQVHWGKDRRSTFLPPPAPGNGNRVPGQKKGTPRPQLESIYKGL